MGAVSSHSETAPSNWKAAGSDCGTMAGADTAGTDSTEADAAAGVRSLP